MSRADEVTYLVKLRDGLVMATDAISEYLETKTPYEQTVKHNPKEFDKLSWETKEGTQGPYQQTSKQTSGSDALFEGLQKILDRCKGFSVLGDHKYWFHQGDKNIIDRRKKGVKTAKKAEKSISEEAPRGPTPMGPKASSDNPRIKDIRSLFSPQLESLLSFEEKAEFIIIKSKQWLGSEDFSEISAIIRGIGGKWISSGKQSHFQVSVK